MDNPNDETIQLPLSVVRELITSMERAVSAEPDAGPHTTSVMRDIRDALDRATPRTMDVVLWKFDDHALRLSMNLDTLDRVVMLYPVENIGGRLIFCLTDTGERVSIAASRLTVPDQGSEPVHLQPSDRLFRFSPSPSILIRTVDDYLACPPGTLLTADTTKGGGGGSTIVRVVTPEGTRFWLTMQGSRADDSMVAGVPRKVVVWGGLVSSQFVVPDEPDQEDEQLSQQVRNDGIYLQERDYLAAPVGECVVGSDGIPWVRMSRHEGWVNKWGEYLSHDQMAGTQRMTRPLERVDDVPDGDEEIEVHNGDYWLVHAAGKRVLVQRSTGSGSGATNPWVEVGMTDDVSDAPSFSDSEITKIGRIPTF